MVQFIDDLGERLAEVVRGAHQVVPTAPVRREAAELVAHPFVLEADAVDHEATPLRVRMRPAATVGLAFKARAGVHTPVSACASGAEALALALDLLRAGGRRIVALLAVAAVLVLTMVSGYMAARMAAPKELQQVAAEADGLEAHIREAATRYGFSQNLVAAIIETGYLNGETIRLDGAIRMAPK